MSKFFTKNVLWIPSPPKAGVVSMFRYWEEIRKVYLEKDQPEFDVKSIVKFQSSYKRRNILMRGAEKYVDFPWKVAPIKSRGIFHGLAHDAGTYMQYAPRGVRKVVTVQVLGSIPPNELADLYRSADLLLNASESESFGNVVAEAMSCGLPVVCYAAGSLRELVVDRETGYLCKVHDELELFEKAAILIGDEAQKMRMGNKGSQRAIEEFSWQKRAKHVYAVYESLLGVIEHPKAI